MAGVHCCQHADSTCSSCFIRNVFTVRVTLYMASSQQLAASSKRSSLEKDKVLRTRRPFMCRDAKFVLWLVVGVWVVFLVHSIVEPFPMFAAWLHDRLL